MQRKRTHLGNGVRVAYNAGGRSLGPGTTESCIPPLGRSVGTHLAWGSGGALADWGATEIMLSRGAAPPAPSLTPFILGWSSPVVVEPLTTPLSPTSRFHASRPPTRSTGGRFKLCTNSFSNIARTRREIGLLGAVEAASYITTRSNFARFTKRVRSEDGETMSADSIVDDDTLRLSSEHMS